MEYNWDVLFGEWKALRGEKTNYARDEVILCRGEDKITYSSYHYLGASEAYSYLLDLPFDVRQSLGQYMKNRVTTEKEKSALDKIRSLGVIK